MGDGDTFLVLVVPILELEKTEPIGGRSDFIG